MASRNPSFFRRIGLAFSVLFGAELAGRLVRMRDEAAAADAEAEASAGTEEAAAPPQPSAPPMPPPPPSFAGAKAFGNSVCNARALRS